MAKVSLCIFPGFGAKMTDASSKINVRRLMHYYIWYSLFSVGRDQRPSNLATASS